MRRHHKRYAMLLAGLSLLLTAIDAQAQRRQRRSGNAKVGAQAPDFTLPVLQGFAKVKKKQGQKHKTVTLSELAARRPVALIFGSYT